MAKLKVTLVKSGIGYAAEQKETLKHLGLRKMWHSVEHEDTPSIRGMLHKVRHLVKVESLVEGGSHEAE